MDFLSTVVSATNNLLWTYVLVVVLVGLGIYFTIITRAVQLRHLKGMARLLTEKASNEGKKGVSSFEAFAISIASRVGTGNLTGVALAIAVGGPGSIFWMWITALLGGASAFIESTLAQIYKTPDKENFIGGPAYYMEKALNKRWMGAVFAVLISLTFGFAFNSVQANTISMAFDNAFHVSPLVMSIIMAFITALIIFGGVERIAAFSGFIVPVMATFYLLITFVILIMNYKAIPGIFSLIISKAFSPDAAIVGGIIGTIQQGVRRGLFSNEAGMGSAPNAAAAAHTSHPVKQGLVQALSVFTDTLIICSATAFIILLAHQNIDTQQVSGIALTQAALSVHISSIGPAFIAIVIFFFAFSSIIGNYFYCEGNIKFLTQNKAALPVFRLLVIAMILWGGLSSLEAVWSFADLTMGFMAIVNLIAIFLLAPIAIRALKDYEQKQKTNRPLNFKGSDIGLKPLEGWPEDQ